MGDTGSMLIGLMLAYAPISSLALLDPASLTDNAAYAAGTVNRYGAFIPLLVPAAILLIPYADLMMAVVRRTRAGKSCSPRTRSTCSTACSPSVIRTGPAC